MDRQDRERRAKQMVGQDSIDIFGKRIEQLEQEPYLSYDDRMDLDGFREEHRKYKDNSGGIDIMDKKYSMDESTMRDLVRFVESLAADAGFDVQGAKERGDFQSVIEAARGSPGGHSDGGIYASRLAEEMYDPGSVSSEYDARSGDDYTGLGDHPAIHSPEQFSYPPRNSLVPSYTNYDHPLPSGGQLPKGAEANSVVDGSGSSMWNHLMGPANPFNTRMVRNLGR